MPDILCILFNLSIEYFLSLLPKTSNIVNIRRIVRNNIRKDRIDLINKIDISDNLIR